MSSISGTQSSGLLQFLQSLSPSSTTSSSASTAASALSAATGHHHKHGGGAGFEKLANAVTTALQSATGNGTSSTDANQTITEALAKIFKNGSLGGASTTDTDNDSDSTTEASDTDSGTSPGGLPASFAATLQSFGVTPQQFQKDLAAALQTAQQSGTADTSSAFKSFPAGSILDTIG